MKRLLCKRIGKLLGQSEKKIMLQTTTEVWIYTNRKNTCWNDEMKDDASEKKCI